MRRPTDISPRGKYRLTLAQEAVLRALGDGCGTGSIRQIGRAGPVVACPAGRTRAGFERDGLSHGQISRAIEALRELKLVERYPLSEHRHGHRLTAEGRLDYALRGPADG